MLGVFRVLKEELPEDKGLVFFFFFFLMFCCFFFSLNKCDFMRRRTKFLSPVTQLNSTEPGQKISQRF